MKSNLMRFALPAGLGVLVSLAGLSSGPLRAQVPWGTPSTPMAQRNALQAVQSQVNWFRNSTQTASSYGGGGGGGYGLVWRQFQMLRGAYGAFKSTLSQQQVASGANELAELDAGLDILQEAFTNYQQEVADGQSSASAFNSMCQVLYQASGVWLQELNSDSARLQVGWQ